MTPDVIAVIAFFAILLIFLIWAVKYEVKYMKTLTAREKKHYELYEAILSKLNEE